MVFDDSSLADARRDLPAVPISGIFTGPKPTLTRRARIGKVLFMSGYTDDAILRHGVLSASVNFIDKPFTPERLGRTIRGVLDGE